MIAYAILTETGGSDDASPVYDEDGHFIGWDTNYGNGTSFRHGFAGRTEVDAGGDKGVIGWSRLVGGTKVLGLARGPESGDHFVWGIPATDLPTTGIALYELIGATHPTMRDDSVPAGTFTGQLSVSFEGFGRIIGLDGAVTIADHTYSVISPGGLAKPALNVASGQIDIADEGPVCTRGDCVFVYRGFLAGEGGAYYGMAYTLRDDADTVLKWVDGVAVFGNPRTDVPIPGEPLLANERDGQIVVSTGRPYYANPQFETAAEARAAILPDGTLDYFEPTPTERIGHGTTISEEVDHIGDVIAWSRWTEGTTSNSKGTTSSNEGEVYTYPEGQSVHLVYGTAATNLPTSGTATYEIVGGTLPRLDNVVDGATGTVSGSAAVAFGATPQVGLDLTVAIDGSSYGLATRGGLADLSQSELTVAPDMTFGAEIGCTGCHYDTARVDGFLAGEGASHLGMTFAIATAAVVTDPVVRGGVVFGKTP
jgi:hypothetical protein